MKSTEFNAKLKVILERTQAEVTELVQRARAENPDDEIDIKPLEFADDPNWQHTADEFVLLGGWIYDRVRGLTIVDKKAIRHRLRRALGFTYP